MPPYVLVVESDPDLQRQIGDQLRDSRYEVATEAEGSWARRSIAVRVPDVLVVDTNLSDAPGFTVADALRRDPETRDTPIVFIASRPHRGAAHRTEATRRYAPARYVIAPAELENLPACLEMAISASGTLLDEDLFSGASPLPPSPGVPLPPSPVHQDEGVERHSTVGAEAPPHLPPPAPETRPLRQSRAEEETRAPDRGSDEGATEHLASTDSDDAGTLRATPFPRVLQRLFARQASGSLLLRRGTTKKIVYFADGTVVAVRSNVLAECLGQILARQRLISAEALQESLRRMKAEARPQGEILVEMGALSPTNLSRALIEQAEAKLYDVFGWTEGRFMFQEGAAPPARVIRLDRAPASVILEGVRRQYDGPRQRMVLAPHAGRYLVLDASPALRLEDMTAEPAEQAFIRSIDGRARLDTLVDAARIPRESALLLVVALLQAGLARASDAPVVSDGSQTSAGAERVPPLPPPVPVPARAERATGADGARPPRPPELPAVVVNAPITTAPPLLNNPADELFRAGMEHLHGARHREAVEALRQAARMVPEQADYRAALGWALFRVAPSDARASRAAIAELRRALQLDPTNRSAHLYLGQLYAQTGHPDQAIAELERLLQLDPDSMEAADQLRRLRG